MFSRWRINRPVAGAIGMVALVVIVLTLGTTEFGEVADKVGSVLGGIGAALTVWGLTGRPSAAATVDPVDRLAELVGLQWNREAARRGLRGSAPMRIRWRVTERPVAVPPDEIVELDGPRVKRLRLEGDVLELAGTWRRLPYRRLVLIGRPGAGKTSAAVLFTVGLLAEREPGEPVPVLLDLTGWRPSEEDFEQWLGRTLAGHYGLGALARQARRLVADRAIVAVLDGFDEMPAGERAAAITGLNELVDLPFILMSRVDEFTATVTASGEPLAHALIVELDPLTPQQTARYLPGGQAGDGARWAPVEHEMAADPAGPLAEVLSNPLAAYLARTVYRRPDTDPAEMIGLAGRGELERHLFDGYLPTVYADRGPRRRGEADRARRWLESLAGVLDGQRVTDFQWWRLGWVGGKRAPVARLAFALVLTVPFALVAALFNGLMFVLFEGGMLVAAVLFYFSDKETDAPAEPRQVRFEARAFMTSVVCGVVVFVPLFVLPSAAPLLTWPVVVVLIAGLGALAVWVNRITFRNYAVGIFLLVKAGRKRHEVEMPDLTANPIGMAYLLGLATTLVRPVPVDELWDPERSVRADRAALLTPPILVSSAAVGITLLFAALGWWEPEPGDGGLLARVVTNGVVAALAIWGAILIMNGSTWLTYAVVRLWMAARGRLPWRLMPFLADAARRGVLRRNGAVYQFRHERLRAHLAGTTEHVTDS